MWSPATPSALREDKLKADRSEYLLSFSAHSSAMAGGIVCNRTCRISTVSRIPHFANASDVESEVCWRGWQAYQPRYDVSLSRTLCSCSGTDTCKLLDFVSDRTFLFSSHGKVISEHMSIEVFQAGLTSDTHTRTQIFGGTAIYLQVMMPRHEERCCRNLWGPWSYGGPNSNF